MDWLLCAFCSVSYYVILLSSSPFLPVKNGSSVIWWQINSRPECCCGNQHVGHSTHCVIVSLRSRYQISTELGNDQQAKVLECIWHHKYLSSVMQRRWRLSFLKQHDKTQRRSWAPAVSAHATAGFSLFEGLPEECFHHSPKHDCKDFQCSSSSPHNHFYFLFTSWLFPPVLYSQSLILSKYIQIHISIVLL